MTNIETNRLRREIISEKAELRKIALAEVKNLSPNEALPILINCLESKNNDVLADISKTLLSYNDDGSLAGECTYQWTNGTWMPYTKTELEYSESGYTKYSYGWTGDKWEMKFKDVHGISKNGDFSVSYIYKNGDFVLMAKSILGYNEDGKEQLRQTWNIQEGNEDKSSYGPRTSYEYDENGNLKSETTYLLDGQGRSENNYKMEYTYDEQGRNTSVESYVWADDQWMLDTIERYDYAETATFISNVNSLVAKSSVKKILANGQINIIADGKSYQIDGK